MSDEFWVLLASLAGGLVAYITGLGGAEAVVEKLKQAWGLSGVWLRVVAGVVAVIVAVITGIASGEVTQALVQDVPAFVEWVLIALGVLSPAMLEWLHQARPRPPTVDNEKPLVTS